MPLRHSELKFQEMMGKAELLGEIWSKERFSQGMGPILKNLRLFYA